MVEGPVRSTLMHRALQVRGLWWVALGMLLTATGALFFLWPIRHVLGDVVLGSAVFAPDAVLNLGILEWGRTSLRSPELRFFEWTAGFPMNNTLAATENLLGWQLFYAPLRSIGLGPVAAYNALMFATIPVSGLTAALLARQLGASRAGAFISGFLFAFAPLFVTQMVHIQIRAMCWAPLTFFFLDRVLLHGRWRDAGGLTLAFLLVSASSIYVGVFIVLGLILYLAAAWMAGHSRVTARSLGRLAASAIVVLVALAPILQHYWSFRTEHAVRHPPSLIVERSHGLEDFVTAPRWQRVYAGTSGEAIAHDVAVPPGRVHDPRAAFPGVVVLGLLLTWLVLRARTPELRVPGRMLCILIVVVTVLSLGPVLKVHSEYPSRFAQWLPLPGHLWLLIPGIRNIWRFQLLAVLFAAVLSGLGVTAVLRRVPIRRRALLLGGILGLLVIENSPVPWFAKDSLALGAPLALSGAYPFLKRDADAGGVVELPIADARGYQTPLMTRYVYGSAGHGRRVVAIHGTARIPVTDSLLDAARALPDPEGRHTLVRAGVSRLVVHRSLMAGTTGDTLVERLRRAGYPVLFSSAPSVVFGLR